MEDGTVAAECDDEIDRRISPSRLPFLDAGRYVRAILVKDAGAGIFLADMAVR